MRYFPGLTLVSPRLVEKPVRVLSLPRSPAPLHHGAYPAIKPAQARREAQAALERVRRAWIPQRKNEPVGTAARRRPIRCRRLPVTPDRHHRQNNRAATYLEAKRNFERDDSRNGKAADLKHQPSGCHRLGRRDHRTRRTDPGQPNTGPLTGAVQLGNRKGPTNSIAGCGHETPIGRADPRPCAYRRRGALALAGV